MVRFPDFPADQQTEPDPTAPRYALYVAPAPGSALFEFGADWLGRDCVTGQDRDQPTVTGIDGQRFAEITESARFYGFHATIKPPFHLRTGRSEAELLDAFAGFAAGRTPFDVTLGLRSLGGFLALMLTPPDHRMNALAADAVRDLDGFRALPSEAELARRREAGLSAQQEALLQQWGYPYVMGEFKFHMTLSSRLPDGPERDSLVAALMPLADAVTETPFRVDAIALFKQDGKAAPFLQVERFVFGG